MTKAEQRKREKSGGKNSLRVRDRQRRRRLFGRLLLSVILAALIIAATWSWASRPMPRPDRPIRLSVPAHSGVIGIGRVLEREGVVRNTYAFAITAKLEGKAADLKAGHYRFAGSLNLDQVIERLQQGPNDAAVDGVRVTVPEGFTLEQIGNLLEAKGVMTAAEFKLLASDPQAIAGLTAEFPLPRTSLEGYLFPDTYTILPHSSPVQIIEMMLQNFNRRFYGPYKGEIEAVPAGLAPLVVKASLIEREAREAADRPRIAAVLDNRLRANMKLQIDATVLYGVPHKNRVLDADLKRNSPYNTYLYAGLPPGPIANPGISSLLAALHPESSDYLYYVARPSGYHIFTRSLAEHEAAVKAARAEWKAYDQSRAGQTGDADR